MKKNARAATKNKNAAVTPTLILDYASPERLCECFVGVGVGVEVAMVELDIGEEDFVLLIETTLLSIESRLPEF